MENVGENHTIDIKGKKMEVAITNLKAAKNLASFGLVKDPFLILNVE